MRASQNGSILLYKEIHILYSLLDHFQCSGSSAEKCCNLSVSQWNVSPNIEICKNNNREYVRTTNGNVKDSNSSTDCCHIQGMSLSLSPVSTHQYRQEKAAA